MLCWDCQYAWVVNEAKTQDCCELAYYRIRALRLCKLNVMKTMTVMQSLLISEFNVKKLEHHPSWPDQKELKVFEK